MDPMPSRREFLGAVGPGAAGLGAALGISVTGGQAAGEEVPGGRGERGSLAQRMLVDAYQGGRYTLPPLPYPYDALEPHIDARTMDLHHNRHHLGYVEGLNRALSDMAEMQAGGRIDPYRLGSLEREISFNGGGHLLHTLFWATMGSGQGGDPGGAVAEAIRANFGGLDTFRTCFTRVAATVKGVGWALLMYEPVGDRLFIAQVNEHDAHVIPGAEPLLPLDVWEHAYYLKYGPGRVDYIQAWWNVVNWGVVEQSFGWLRSHYRRAALITSGR
jgi:Fe-Mn family superoxide dismutase